MSIEANSKFISEAEIFEAFCEEHKPPNDLIFDDGKPLETKRHRIAMNVPIRSLERAWNDRNDFFLAAICSFITAALRYEADRLAAKLRELGIDINTLNK